MDIGVLVQIGSFVGVMVGLFVMSGRIHRDISVLRTEVREDIASLRGEMKVLRTEVREDIAALRGEIKAVDDRLLRYLLPPGAGARQA